MKNLLIHDTGNAMPGTHGRRPDIAIADRLSTDDRSTYNSQFHVFSNCPVETRHANESCDDCALHPSLQFSRFCSLSLSRSLHLWFYVLTLCICRYHLSLPWDNPGLRQQRSKLVPESPQSDDENWPSVAQKCCKQKYETRASHWRRDLSPNVRKRKKMPHLKKLRVR